MNKTSFSERQIGIQTKVGNIANVFTLSIHFRATAPLKLVERTTHSIMCFNNSNTTVTHKTTLCVFVACLLIKI